MLVAIAAVCGVPCTYDALFCDYLLCKCIPDGQGGFLFILARILLVGLDAAYLICDACIGYMVRIYACSSTFCCWVCVQVLIYPRLWLGQFRRSKLSTTLSRISQAKA